MPSLTQIDLSKAANFRRFEELHVDRYVQAEGMDNNGELPPLYGMIYKNDVCNHIQHALSAILDN